MAKVKFLRGESVDLKSHFSDHEIKEMNDQKLLQVSGKKEFKQGDKVLLDVKIKNIKTLTIRVFEVNTESYLLKNQTENYDEINVNFLIPTEEYLYSFDKPSQLIHTQTLSFDHISTRKFGVFIINLIGDEIYAKAIVKKGKLALVYDSILGRQCMILDDE